MEQIDLVIGSTAVRVRGMYRPPHQISAHDLFADQFAWNRDAYLYRYRGVGPAYRVTSDAMLDFIDAFDRWQKWSAWLGVTVVIGVVAIVFLALPSDQWLARSDIAVAARASAGPLFAAAWNVASTYLAFRQPMRRMAGSSPVAAPLPKAKRSRVLLDQVSGGELSVRAMIAIGIATIVLLTSGWSSGPFGLALLAGCTVVLGWAIVQGVRKWTLSDTA